MSLPKEPRAMMIQFMYLVYTAMLAMNITKEVLDSFKTINDSIELSNTTLTDKNTRMYQAFETAANDPQSKVSAAPLLAKANQAKELSAKMYAYLEMWKDSVINVAGGYETLPDGTKEIKTMDDLDAASHLFIEQKHGKDVKDALRKYVDDITNIIDDPKEREDMKKSIPLVIQDPKKSEDNVTGDWAYGTFHNVPVVAAATLFSKYQMDVKNAEGMVVEYLASKINADVHTFQDFMAVATPNTSYALNGDEITANIALVAYNKLAPHGVTISSSAGAVQVKDGYGTLKFRASGAGSHTVNGRIVLPGQGGTPARSFDYKFNYTVGTSGASVQLDKMNVLYVGLDNPITVSASGYNIEDVNFSVGGGVSVNRAGNGKFIIKPTQSNPGVDYTVTAKNKAGGTDVITSGKLRIRNVPTPIVKFSNVTGGRLPIERIRQSGLVAVLEDFVFDGVRFEVVSYDFTFAPADGENGAVEKVRGTNGRLDGKTLQDLSRARSGDKVFFENIVLEGPDHKPRPGGAITIVVR